MAAAAVNYVTTDTTIEFGYTSYLVDASSQSIILTLPTITTDGMNFTIKRYDTNANNNIVTLIPQSGELIDGLSTKLLNPNTNTTVNSLNSVWYTVSGNSMGNEINIAFSQIQGTQTTRPFVTVNNPAFTALGYFNYNGTSYYGSNPIKLEILYSINSDSTQNVDFTIRLFDLTNTLEIAIIGPITQIGNNVTFYKASTYIFTNLPLNASTIEIDGRINSGTITVRLHSVRLILD